jgi:hypothetical protein
MLQRLRPKPIQGLILDPAIPHILQDESCAPAHASRERGIYAAAPRPKPIQGLILDPAIPHVLQDESCSCACRERGIYAADWPTPTDLRIHP